MKRTGFKKKATKQLKRTPLKKKRVTKLKRDLMPNRVKRAKKELVELSHTFIRKRDGINGEIRGYCFDCGLYVEGQQFQCGHFEADSVGGALLRYHPWNMHGQAGGCNTGYNQERVKIAYTLKMIDKYGREKVDFLRSLKSKSIKADIIFYETMIELYKQGDEQAIVDYLHSL